MQLQSEGYSGDRVDGSGLGIYRFQIQGLGAELGIRNQNIGVRVEKICIGEQA